MFVTILCLKTSFAFNNTVSFIYINFSIIANKDVKLKD